MAMLRTLIVVVVAITMVVSSAMAANHTVGAPNGGWDQSTNLQSWASSETFQVGDNLIFTYSPMHDVNEVSKADYDACTSTNPISTNSGGNTVVPLATPGKRYFICGTFGHCSLGMKLEVNVLAATAQPPASPTPIETAPAPVASSPAPVASSPVSAASSPVDSPAPVQSRKAHSPVHAPAASPSESTLASPALSPVDPSTDAASPPVLDFPGVSPSGARDSLPPSPSSANRISAIAGSAAAFGVVFFMSLL